MNIFEVKKIKILKTEKEVNDYLHDGWILFRVFSESIFLLVSFSIEEYPF